MAATDDAKLILDTLSGNVLSPAQMLEIGKNFINYRDSMAMTNEAIAQEFLDQLRTIVRKKVKTGATIKYEEDNLAAKNSNADSSIANL